jgi:prolyl oligopeptidase
MTTQCCGLAFRNIIKRVAAGLAGCLLAAGLLQARAWADSTTMTNSEDPYLWLEDVAGAKPLDWVRARNAASQQELEKAPEFEPIRKRLLEILNSKERIPFVAQHGKWLYNFWQDEKNPRGLWRRATLAEYKKASPSWEVVLDLDELARADKTNWVWKGAEVLEPDNDLALVNLSHGGADAAVIREFDLKKKRFVTDGFFLPEAKSEVSWIDRNTIFVGTDFGPGSLTHSGYPRIVKEWKRGTAQTAARTVMEGQVEDVSISAGVARSHSRTDQVIHRGVSFFSNEAFIKRGTNWVRLEKPADAEASLFNDHLLLRLRSDWSLDGKTYKAGSLLGAEVEGYLKGKRDLAVLFEPTPQTSLAGHSQTRHYLILNTLDKVSSRIYLLRLEHGKWQRAEMDVPGFSTANAGGLDPLESDDYFLTVENSLTPCSLWLGTAGRPGRAQLKTAPSFFQSDGLEVTQHEAVSADGTRVPYFQVSRKGLALNGENPTLLYGYGGFEISMRPSYSGGIGAAWLERGGVYVLANIRGGGEFGPAWHNAARKEHRQRAYDDFIAVAQDLSARKVTSPKHLGIQGGSNGGLLMGVMLTERPDLFGAVVCQVPLLDMRRFHRLLAGASWMDEYGDPDKPAEWAYISRYSPYQNVFADRKYPRVLFTTSTRDDRVHPGHARKMVARMLEQGHSVLYYENIEGGHGGSANNEQRAFMQSLGFAFLWSVVR